MEVKILSQDETLTPYVYDAVVYKGYSPYIGDNGKWWAYNELTHKYYDTGVTAGSYDDTEIRGIIAGKVDKVTGKGLSANDYDAAAKAKVDAIPSNPKYTDTVYDDTEIQGEVTQLKEDIDVLGLSIDEDGNIIDSWMEEE